MSRGHSGDVTRLLRRLDAGERDAVAELVPLVYDELRDLAGMHLRQERRDHTLQPTALVHEALIRLMKRERMSWEDRRHFLLAASGVMRSILVNHARDRRRLKRGGGAARVLLDEIMIAYEERALDLAALNEALDRLARIDWRCRGLVDLRFFAGLSLREAAEVLGISERTAKSDWALARKWLWRELKTA